MNRKILGVVHWVEKRPMALAQGPLLGLQHLVMLHQDACPCATLDVRPIHTEVQPTGCLHRLHPTEDKPPPFLAGRQRVPAVHLGRRPSGVGVLVNHGERTVIALLYFFDSPVSVWRMSLLDLADPSLFLHVEYAVIFCYYDPDTT